MTATTKCCNVEKVLAMWVSSTDAQVWIEHFVPYCSTREHFRFCFKLLSTD
jgi:hypothetical protein